METEETNNFIIEDTVGSKMDSLFTPYVERLMRLTDNEAAIAIGITDRDKIIYARAFGHENIEKGTKADLNTVFHIASVSKPFTAAAIIKLIEQGKVKLDDRIIDHIPSFRMKGSSYENVTIKHVLNHTSGIPRHITENDWEHPSYGPSAWEGNLEHVRDFELDFEPGSQFNYSNAAFDILGIVISRVAGMPFHEYVAKEILHPTEMDHSFYLKPPDSLPVGWAASYSYGLETQEWSPYPYTENYFPSSGMQTTVLDMSKWGMLHLNHGIYNGESVIRKEEFDLLSFPYYDTPWGDKIGLSWFLQSYLDRPIIMHTGNDTGFEAIMYIYPVEGYSIVVMANRDLSRTGRIINAASEILFDTVPKDYSVSARYKFADMYKKEGLEEAVDLWEKMEKDTADIYYTDEGDILTIGAILENGKNWEDAKNILEHYITLNENSTYAWRLLGNAHLNLGDTLQAISCYKQTQEINPNYEKGRVALEKLLGGN